MIRLPKWMADFLREQAVVQETTPSALIRLALRKAFSLSSDAKNAGIKTSTLGTDKDADADAEAVGKR